jgi:hypothetical protein
MPSALGGDNVSDQAAAERRAEQLLRAILDGTAAVTGTAFFGSLVQHLASALGVRRVYVAECLDADHARARAVWMDSDFAPPFEYNVVDTPCMKVTRGETCLYASHVQQYFPQNKFLPTMNAQSYLGIPLWNANHRVTTSRCPRIRCGSRCSRRLPHGPARSSNANRPTNSSGPHSPKSSA